MYYEGNNELYHHGILGQRWGKRNGPPYPLDAEDHSKGEKKAGWRKSLSSGSDDKKPSVKVKRTETKNVKTESNKSFEATEQTKLTAQQKKVIGKYLAAGGAIVLTGAGIYAGIKIADAYRKNKYDASKDWEIAAGTTLFRVEARSADFQAGDHFYATVSKADAPFYNGIIGERAYDNVQKVIKAQAPLKIAGTGTVKDVVKKLIAEDKDFGDWYKNSAGAIFRDSDVTDQQLAFLLRNAPMGEMGPDTNSNWKKVENKLFDLGYRGLVDANDMFNLGANTKEFNKGRGWEGASYAPVIFFNSQEGNYQHIKSNTINDPSNEYSKYEALSQIRNTPWVDIGLNAAISMGYVSGVATIAGVFSKVKTPEEAIARGWSSAEIAKKFKMSESQVVDIRDNLKQDKKK